MQTNTDFWYLLAADALLFGHAMFVAFVVFGLALILFGKIMGWLWVRNLWFRIAHLVAIAVVVLQSWAGVICPLTTWEMALRERAGSVIYAGSFVSHWLEVILYYQAPGWVLAACYSAFGALIVASWFWVPPRCKLK